ncbi:hypothetical protein VTJ04DRAFT_2117 [Mycothermus thermophilus]
MAGAGVEPGRPLLLVGSEPSNR